MSDPHTTPAGPAADDSDRYHHRRPIDAGFYERLRQQVLPAGEKRTVQLGPEGTIISAQSGDFLSLTLEGDAQAVLLYAWNPHEPRERIWNNETSSVEDCFLSVDSRMWSTMPWFRALLTLVEDTVDTIDVAGAPVGRHHFVLDGWETPAVWAAQGGASAIPTAWDRFERLLTEAGADPRLHRDHVALFRKVAIDPSTQRMRVMGSDAVAGDRVTLYAEMDVEVALVPSPYRGGGALASQMDGHVAPVRLDAWPSGIEPLGWPYPGVPYPDIAPYVDALGGSAE